MIIKLAALEQLLKRPGSAIRAVMFYGPNEGRVHEYALQAARTVVSDLTDPFRVSSLTAAGLINDPASLADEAAALSMTGGRRVVRLQGAEDAHTDCFINFLEDPPGDSLIVVQAGALPKTSKLRKLFETNPRCAIAACYEESAADLDALVIDHLRRNGLSITSEAREYLLHFLGEDRLAARQELDKLVLYKGVNAAARTAIDDFARRDSKVIQAGIDTRDIHGANDSYDVFDTVDTAGIKGALDSYDVLDGIDTDDNYAINDAGDIMDIQGSLGVFEVSDVRAVNDVTATRDIYDVRAIHAIIDTRDTSAIQDDCVNLADVMACIGDSSSQGLDGICDAMAMGDFVGVDSQLIRAFDSAMAPIAILRAASNHLLRLQLAVALMAQGVSADMVMRQLRPPVFFNRADDFRRQLRLWDLPRLARALEIILQAEAACKTTGAPDISLMGHALMQVTQLIRRRN